MTHFRMRFRTLLLWGFVCVMLLQMGLLLLLMAAGGLWEGFDRAANNSLSAQMAFTQREINSRLGSAMADLEVLGNTVDATAAQLMGTQFTATELAPKADALLTEAAPFVIQAAARTNTGGAFVLLLTPDAETSGRYPCLLLHDSEINATAPRNTDLFFVRGPVTIARGFGLALDAGWTPLHTARQTGGDAFFTAAIAACRAAPKASVDKAGYWSAPFRLGDSDLWQIAYTLPLRNDTGTIYGAVGVTYTAAQLSTFLVDGELSFSDSFLTLTPSVTTDYYGARVLVPDVAAPFLAYSGHGYDQLNPRRQPSLSIAKADGQRPVAFFLSGEDTGYLGYALTFSPYPPESAFYGQTWTLGGGVRAEELHNLSRTTATILLTSFSVSLLLGLLMTLGFCLLVMRPINQLVATVQSYAEKDSEPLPRTRIDELNTLTDAIEEMRRHTVAVASAELAADGNDAALTGLFDVNRLTDTVLLSAPVCHIIGISIDADATDKTLPLSEWETLIGHKIRDERMPQLLRYTTPDGTRKHLSVRIIESASQHLVGTMTDTTLSTQHLAQLEREKETDPLTGLLNRLGFREYAEHHLFHHAEDAAAILFFDLDNLKFINDTYGHDTGDQYIRAAGEAISLCAGHGGLCARFSGDEFVVLLPQPQVGDLRSLAAQLFQAITSQTYAMPDGLFNRIRISCGIALYPADAKNLEQLVHYADFAMYEIKHSMKGEYRFFDVNTYKRDSYLLSKAHKLNLLLEERRFHFAFQPIFSLKENRLYGYEALLRPDIPDLNSPMEVLRLASAQSRLYEVEHMCIFAALDWMRANQERMPEQLLFVNSLSDQALTPEDAALIDEKYRDLLAHMVLEVVESSVAWEQHSLEKIDHVRRYGCSIAIDDFGAGYSNELALLSLKPNYIKIDISIISGIDKDTRRQHLLGNAIAYAKRQQMVTIAEGVETYGELKMLVELGVDCIQGYYIGRPEKEIGWDRPEIAAQVAELRQYFKTRPHA